MNIESEKRLLAKALGWKWMPNPKVIHPSKDSWWVNPNDHPDTLQIINQRGFGFPEQGMPPWESSLDAIAIAEEFLKGKKVDLRSLYYDNLRLCVTSWPSKYSPELFFEIDYAVMTASAIHRFEALCRTLVIEDDPDITIHNERI